MASVEWNKKEELVAEQALKHLKVIFKLLEGLLLCNMSCTTTGLYISFPAILSKGNSTTDLIDQDAGVLLRQYELYESFPQNSTSVLQEYVLQSAVSLSKPVHLFLQTMF